MGEKKENFLRKSAAAVEGVWLNSKKSGKKKWIDTVP